MTFNPKLKLCKKCKTFSNNPPKDFYKSSSTDDGLISICKKCCNEIVDSGDLRTLISLLKDIDRPFIAKLWDSSMDKENPFGEYIRKLNSMKQYKKYRWEDTRDDYSYIYGESNDEKTNEEIEVDDILDVDVPNMKYLLMRWGRSWTKDELLSMEGFYREMEDKYNVDSPTLEEQVMTLAKIREKRNKALEQNDINAFKQLSEVYERTLASAGLKPSERKSGNEMAGLMSFNAVWNEIEKDGFIPKWDTKTTQDIVDKTIMYISNFTLKLLEREMMVEPPIDTPKVEGGEEHEDEK